VRINRFVASSSGLSRRAADEAIAAGRVKINGHAAALGQNVEPAAAVTLDGTPLAIKTGHTYLMLNKPTGYVSSHVRQTADPTLYELIPAEYAKLRITGRLDRDSSGLILLSDDGDFIQSLAHPSRGKTKEYELTLSSAPTPDHLAKLAAGIPLRDGISRITVTTSSGKHLTVTLGEGRNRQIRRTFGSLGLTVERLHRTRIGSYELGNLPAGGWQLVNISGGKI